LKLVAGFVRDFEALQGEINVNSLVPNRCLAIQRRLQILGGQVAVHHEDLPDLQAFSAGVLGRLEKLRLREHARLHEKLANAHIGGDFLKNRRHESPYPLAKVPRTAYPGYPNLKPFSHVVAICQMSTFLLSRHGAASTTTDSLR